MIEELGDFGTIVSIVLTLCVALLSYIYAYLYQLKSKKSKQMDMKKLFAAKELPELPTIRLTLDQLLGFDGTRSDGRILVALKGKIYDVSSDLLEFGLGGTLSHVAGRDFTNYLDNIMRTTQTEVNYVDRWEAILETNYSRVGFIIDKFGNALVEKVKVIDSESEPLPESDSEGITKNLMPKIILNDVLETENLPAIEMPLKSIENSISEQAESSDI